MNPGGLHSSRYASAKQQHASSPSKQSRTSTGAGLVEDFATFTGRPKPKADDKEIKVTPSKESPTSSSKHGISPLVEEQIPSLGHRDPNSKMTTTPKAVSTKAPSETSSSKVSVRSSKTVKTNIGPEVSQTPLPMRPENAPGQVGSPTASVIDPVYQSGHKRTKTLDKAGIEKSLDDFRTSMRSDWFEITEKFETKVELNTKALREDLFENFEVFRGEIYGAIARVKELDQAERDVLRLKIEHLEHEVGALRARIGSGPGSVASQSHAPEAPAVSVRSAASVATPPVAAKETSRVRSAASVATSPVIAAQETSSQPSVAPTRTVKPFPFGDDQRHKVVNCWVRVKRTIGDVSAGNVAKQDVSDVDLRLEIDLSIDVIPLSLTLVARISTTSGFLDFDKASPSEYVTMKYQFLPEHIVHLAKADRLTDFAKLTAELQKAIKVLEPVEKKHVTGLLMRVTGGNASGFDKANRAALEKCGRFNGDAVGILRHLHRELGATKPPVILQFVFVDIPDGDKVTITDLVDFLRDKMEVIKAA